MPNKEHRKKKTRWKIRVKEVKKMDKQEDISASYLRALFLANLAEIPNVEPSIGARGGEDGLIMRRPLNLENLVLVGLEGVQLQLQVPQIPERHGFVGRAGGQDKFRVGIERETVHFRRMRVDDVRGFVGVVGSSVPNHQLLVVGDGAEERFVQQVPRDVLHDGRVPVINGQSVENATLPRLPVDIP